ncbi:MAG: hypothetical protein IJ235_05665, partial [Eubacterium sp.]|nr:hypothetical protein [Eubacterium sp.]
NGAALATFAAFVVVFAARCVDTRRFIKIKFNTPIIFLEVAILAVQAVVMLRLESGLLMYAIEAILVLLMLLINLRQITELVNLLIGKFLKKRKN